MLLPRIHLQRNAFIPNQFFCYKVPKAKKQDGRSERAVRKQIMKTGDHGCDDGGHCNIYRSV